MFLTLLKLEARNKTTCSLVLEGDELCAATLTLVKEVQVPSDSRMDVHQN